MKITTIASEIHQEIGSPTDTSILSIEYWIRAKVGELNNLLFESFVIDDNSLEILDSNNQEIDINAASILKKLYKVYYYEVQIRAHMSAVTTDTILSVSDQGSSVTKVNRNEISKTLASLKKDEQAELNNLVSAYRLRKTTPSQVAGDDTICGDYDRILRIR